jgi:hypothetical protein
MSEKARAWLIFGVLFAALAGGALLITSLGDEESEVAREAERDRGEGVAPIDPVAGDLARDVAEEKEREQAHSHAHEDGPVAAEQLALEEDVRSESAPVAERFFSAFSRYEIGDLSDAVADELRSTATPSYARELLQAPPRPPLTGGVPPRASLAGALSLVPLAAGGGELVRIELVGEVARPGTAAHPIAFEMTRSGAGWRVSGLSE